MPADATPAQAVRNAEQWSPSKYVPRRGHWRGSRDARALGVGSRLIADRVVALYESHLPQFARGRLLDLGCGLAPLYGLYGARVATVTCVDWPQSVHASPYVDVEADLAQPLPLGDAAFDTVILSDVLEHVGDPVHLWAEIERVLAPGGHLLMNVPFLYPVHEAPHDHARYTRFALQRFAAEAGLAVCVLVPVGGSLHVLADLLAKHLAVLPLAGPTLAAALQAGVGALDRFGWAQRLAGRSAEHFPLGYFMVAAKGG